MKPTDLNLAPLEGDLNRFEEILEKNIQSDLPLMRDAARHVVLAGGKRLRPALALACAYGVNGLEPTTDDVLKGACAIELVHAGSLHHDDVIDNATTRRAIPSVNVQFTNTVAILSGDYLLSQASMLAASLGADVSALLAETISQLAIGQIIEQQNLFDARRTREQYLLAIEGKTASLFASACKIGAMVAGAETETVEALHNYGYNIGMTFQIIDDLLDLTADEEVLGKPAGHDVTEGVYTLPVIFAASNDARVKEVLGDHLTAAELDEVLVIAREPRFIDQTFSIARDYGLRAAESLAYAQINAEVRDSFTRVIDGLLTRTF
ncbi:MAG TPA: polyprenyl synthetase family protein [Acidimicrobiia bacterium]|nr:polyprenyl synthetase family protein [Acidimicrobiia bacterium]